MHQVNYNNDNYLIVTRDDVQKFYSGKPAEEIEFANLFLDMRIAERATKIVYIEQGLIKLLKYRGELLEDLEKVHSDLPGIVDELSERVLSRARTIISYRSKVKKAEEVLEGQKNDLMNYVIRNI